MEIIPYDPTATVMDVAMGTGYRGESPQLLSTQGINTCIGLAVRQPTDGRGSLYHIAAGSSTRATFDQLIEEELARLGSGMDVWVGSGLCTYLPIGIQFAKETRIYISHRLHQLDAHLGKIQKRYETTNGRTLDRVSIDLMNGEITVKTRRYSRQHILARDRQASSPRFA